MKTTVFLIQLLVFALVFQFEAKSEKPVLKFVVSMPQPASHLYHVEFHVDGFADDTVVFKMPKWMPGYYQLMNYAGSVENIAVLNEAGKEIPLYKINENTWILSGFRSKSLTVRYNVKAEKQFVANSFLDNTHAYIVPANNFMYIDGFINNPVTIELVQNPNWSGIATGLEKIAGTNVFYAPDFDILYDCPILIGNHEELTPFEVHGVEHRFVGYKMGDFDKKLFMGNLKKVVEAAVDIFGDIPYKNYTFIAIGPGRGGIEHLNNTTISFDGNSIKTAEDMNRTMNFIGHEYFHHYNVKRIRPFELGPFNYDRENRTTQLWVSEGLTVYYEYIIAKRAGLANEKTFLANFEENINAVENNPGRLKQSLSQSGYYTWNDGPFGKKGETISYYDKGPVVGLFLDLSIRNATQNKKSLDDVMRFLYWEYYKKLQRGFTDAEFQQACEQIAGISMANEFEYVNTTKELDYNKYLGYAGLKTTRTEDLQTKKVRIEISQIENPDEFQTKIYKSLLNL